MLSRACARISQTPGIKLCMKIYVFASFFQSFDVLNFGHEFERQFASTRFQTLSDVTYDFIVNKKRSILLTARTDLKDISKQLKSNLF